MRKLLMAFWDIALWRRDPGYLPDSLQLLAVVAGIYAVFSAVQSWMIYGTDQLLARTAADLLLSALLVWLVLLLTHRRYRFRQTLCAVLGTGALLSPLVILLLALRGLAAANDFLALLIWAASVAVIIWYIFIVGHIARAALDTGLFTGMAVGVSYVVASTAILVRLFPEAS